MKVMIDDQIFSDQSDGGISRYFSELMRSFVADAALGVDLVSPMFWTKNRYLMELRMGRRLPTQLGRKGRVLRAANRYKAPTRTPDLIHHTYYHPAYLERFKDAAVRVVTVHDMIPELFPDLFPGGSPHLFKESFVEAADLVLCVSEVTRQDLLEIYGTSLSKTAVVHLGVDPRFQPGSSAPVFLPERYVLFVGSRSGYKDFGVLAEAFAKSGLSNDTVLVAIGGGTFTDAESTLLDRLGIGARVLQFDASDDELAGAYANAACFVFPSRYEGFGLPTIEAMASGCVTILAASSSHIEIGGKAALFFAPGDNVDLAGVLGQVMSDRDLIATMTAAGLARSAGFTWGATARKTVASYNEALMRI